MLSTKHLPSGASHGPGSRHLGTATLIMLNSMLKLARQEYLQSRRAVPRADGTPSTCCSATMQGAVSHHVHKTFRRVRGVCRMRSLQQRSWTSPACLWMIATTGP